MIRITIGVCLIMIVIISLQFKINSLQDQNIRLEAQNLLLVESVVSCKQDVGDWKQNYKSCNSILESTQSEFEKLWKNIEKDEVEGNDY